MLEVISAKLYSLLLLVIQSVLVIAVPFIIKQLYKLVDNVIEYFKLKAKAIENERIRVRLLDLFNIIDNTAEAIFAELAEIKFDKKNGSITITNADKIYEAVRDSVYKQLTASTKELVEKLGSDLEEIIRIQVQARLELLKKLASEGGKRWNY